MKLDTWEQRCKVIDDLVEYSFKVDAKFLHDRDNYNEWNSNIEIMKHLFISADLIHSETMFLTAQKELDGVKTDDKTAKSIYSGIFKKKAVIFVATILLPVLQQTANSLRYWQFNTDYGKKFHRKVHKQIDALIEKYEDLYLL